MMEKISILSVFLGFLLVCHKECRAECNNDEFYHKTRQSCEKCPPCPAGKQIAQNCGHDKLGHKTGKPACSNCTAGMNFNDKEGGSCKFCQSCDDKGKITIRACTVKSNTVCGCPKGKYARDGDCVQCSYCCGENWENSTNVVPACKKWSHGRCICRPKFYCRGNCSIPTTSTMTTQTTPKTTTVQTETKNTSPLNINTQEYGTKSSPTKRKDMSARNTQEHGTTSSPTKRKDISPRNTQEQGTIGMKMLQTAPKTLTSQGEKLVYPYLKPGWIVLICLGTVLVVGVIAILFYRKQTRKLIHGFCCRNYKKISDVDPSQAALVVESQHEGHYEEPAPNEAENNATPIPPGEEPVPCWYTSLTAEGVYCACRTREKEDWQIECACAMDKPETSIGKLMPNTSSTETISDEFFRYTKESEQERQASTWKISPSTSTSSRLSCPQTSQNYYCTCSSSSNNGAPSPLSGRSPEHLCKSKNCTTTLPTRRDSWDMASSNSPCMSLTSPNRRSPAHRCATPSSCVSSASSRERSPIPPSLPSVQSHSSFSADDHEMCNQSSEYAQKREPLTPVSVEAHDKEHDRNGSEAAKDSLSPTSGKRKECAPRVGRNSSSPKKGMAFARKHDSKMKENWTPKQTGDTNKDVNPICTSDRGLGYDTTPISGSDMEIRPLKEDENDSSKHPRCDYRPIRRNENSPHRCSECCPQPDDSFFRLIDRERTCLKDAICRELNKSSDYKDVARYFRVDSEMAEYIDCANPAERVLDKIKASHPGLKLKVFEEMLREKLVNERHDIVDIIQNHHISCTLCQRNRFDSKAYDN